MKLGTKAEQQAKAAAILRRYRDGGTAIQIACDLGYSLDSVNSILKTRGLKGGDNGRRRPGPRRVDPAGPGWSEWILLDPDWADL